MGRLLAKSIALPFVDTDELIIQTTGQAIQTTVSEKGWPHFRQLETKTMAAVCDKDGQVVGTGGGVILNSANVHAMRRCGKVVWLSAAPETIARRIRTDRDSQKMRPSLTGKSASSEVVAVLSQRTALYRQAADIEVQTDGRSPAEVAETIIQALASHGKKEENA